MTESELEQLRLHIRSLVHQHVLNALCTVLAREHKAFLLSLLQTGNQNLYIEAGKLTIPGFPPEWSDLVAGEFQEAFQELLFDMRARFL